MALSKNSLRVQVDTPIWEWCRFAPVVSSALSASCVGDIATFNATNSRYLYYSIAAVNFWRYDTWTDTWLQLASPLNANLVFTSMRFAGDLGYFGRVISATSTTITTGLAFANSCKGFKIRIISGKGAGQERIISSVAEPVVADYGAATAGATTSVTDTTKTWTSGYVGSTLNVNNWVGYTVRVILGTGLLQMAKILYNSSTVLTIGDVNLSPIEPWGHTTWTAPASGSNYQIESSVVTVDTAWTTTPDNTSRYVIQAGGIYMLSEAAATPFYTLQYYSVLEDRWYVKPALTNMVNAIPTDASLERTKENASIWEHSIATAGSTTTLTDTTKNWTVNQWTNYSVYIYSGTGSGQISAITSNTATVLTLTSTLGTGLDATSRYQIIGFDAGTASSAGAYTLSDSTKSWAVNRWSNYAVRILSGTGAGQVRSISSNTATQLTVYQNWFIAPDSTSIYSIQGDPDNLYFSWSAISQVFLYRNGGADTLSHGRVVDSGVACTMAARRCDVNHVIYEELPIAISTITNVTTTATATTVQVHNLKVNQYVSIYGATGSDAQFYDGVFQIVTVSSTTTFTYTMGGTPAGSAVGVGAQSTTVIFDGSKDYRQLASGGTSGQATITFSTNTPTHINGWYVAGTGISSTDTTLTKVVSGAGTTTLTLSNNNTGTVSGIITFNYWAPSTTSTANTGSSGALTFTTTASTASYINGWYVTGTGVGVGALVQSGAGTTTVTVQVINTATVSGTLTFSSPYGNYMFYGNSGAVTVTTGLAVGQSMQITTNTGNSLTVIAAMGAAMTAGTSRYVIAKQPALGAYYDQPGSNTYYSGVAVGTQSTTTLVDSNAFWTSASGNGGSAQSTTVTLGNTSPTNITGWYLTSGTGINVGAQVVSGAGTTSLVMSVANSGAVSGSLTFCAWNTNLLQNRRLKFISNGSVSTQDVAITLVAATTGTITFALATAPVTNVTTYSIISAPTHGLGSAGLNWAFGVSNSATRGRYMYMPRGGATNGIDRYDLTTDAWLLMHNEPTFETLTTGSMYAYDGGDRLYFTKDATQRVYYLDLSTNIINGAGLFPYVAPTAIIGNRMEIFTTIDGLKYLFLNRASFQECFKQLLFY
ncbi:MAG: hypothetical protein HY220_01105 [Candidatus Sungbacteria bacterium]|uniref:Uncharacterized protein n=1 Tax=Candidatus Sungiibacteriota bacterium TaxID=2750080 RepID=A0A9D6LTC5_9BACT|nr:hypothetical protein [Candidatus Sungbacteria bacterium]